MPPWPPEHGPTRWPSCWVWGLTTLQRWRRQFAGDGGGLDRRKGSHRQCLAASPTRSANEFCSSATSSSSQSCHRVQIVPALADRGLYVGSERSYYRVLYANGQSHRRGRARPPQEPRPVPRLKPEDPMRTGVGTSPTCPPTCGASGSTSNW
jgi:putative transposase